MTHDIEQFLEEWKSAERAGDAGKLESLLTVDFVGAGPLGPRDPRVLANPREEKVKWLR